MDNVFQRSRHSVIIFMLLISWLVIYLIISLLNIQPINKLSSSDLIVQNISLNQTKSSNSETENTTNSKEPNIISAILTETQFVDIHQFALLERLKNSSLDQSRSFNSIQPYLLSDYAAQCKAYMGTVPKFSCIDGTNVLTSQVVTVSKALGTCPQLGIDGNCVITGTVEGRLITPTDAPPDTEVTILFSCRRYDTLTPEGRFDDIAVIQHDKKTGNTCWFQSPTVFAFDGGGNSFKDKFGNQVYQDWQGKQVPSPMDFGAENFWLHPYNPNDALTDNFATEMREGKRGNVAPMGCQDCHDADPFVWDPYVSGLHKLQNRGSTGPAGWHLSGNYVSNSFGLFNADGIARSQARTLVLTSNLTSYSCDDCHSTNNLRLGENTMRGKSKNGHDVVNLLTILASDTVNGNAWMPPTESGLAQITDDVKTLLRDCAEDKIADPSVCSKSLPDPLKRANVKLEVVSEPKILVAGHQVRYVFKLSNSGIYTNADIATGLTFSITLANGLVVQALPGDCSKTVAEGQELIRCPVKDLENGEQQSITLTAQVGNSGNFTSVVNTFTVQSNSTDLNLRTLQITDSQHIRRNVELSLQQNATLEPETGTPVTNFKAKYSLIAANAGPAVANNVQITQHLPAGAIYDPILSSPRCSEAAGIVLCNLDNLSDGRSSTIHIFATLSASTGPFFANEAVVSSDSPDSNSANNRLRDVLIDSSAVQQQFLPIIVRSGPQGADLIVEKVAVTASGTEVTIRNVGDLTVRSEDGFWVDLYINPASPPTAVNQTIQELHSQGLVWGVFSPALQLDPGQSYTLRVGDTYFVSEKSNIPPRINAGSIIYVQVDSANEDSDFGGVVEVHEVNGGSYNNIQKTVTDALILTGGWKP